ncbi:MAG: quinon protein alcohol dehydrogenase-like superfamily [Benniella sp.]|nr:MAG: quinon protein alcohol dehydrogenase-like superfamily [Benniella sp.]
MDPTIVIAPTPFPYVVTSPNDHPLYWVREQLADGTTSIHLNYLYKGRNLVGSDPFLCKVFVAADKGAQAVHAIIDVGEDGMVVVLDPFGHETTIDDFPLHPRLWAQLLPGEVLQVGTSRLRIETRPAQSITSPITRGTVPHRIRMIQRDLGGGGAGSGLLPRDINRGSKNSGVLFDTITVLEQLRTDSDPEKQTIYQSCLEDGLNSRPLVTDILWMETSPLLERLQNKPDAKASLKAPDDTHFPLMQSVKEFLEDGQHQVFLLLGDSGAGKSTFTKALECALWDDYKKKDELKDHRKLILICDGYDESQQTKNLYTANRLNQSDEWQAKMVISCRSEYENIAIGSWNRRIRLWDVGSGKYRSILIGHTSGIIHPNQRHLISKDHNDFLRVWEVETGACCHILQVSGCHVLSPRGNQIAFYKKRDDEAIELRDVETGASFRRLSGHEWPINNVAYSRQGDHIIAGDVDMAVRLWDIETGECL